MRVGLIWAKCMLREQRLDRITKSLLNDFVFEQSLAKLTEADQFEHFAAYSVVRKHFSQNLDTSDVVLGGGADTGIDAIATLVNGYLISDSEDFEDRFGSADYLEVQFVFVQADRGAGFDAMKIGNFGFGVADFFSDDPKLPRSEDVQAAANLMASIYNRSGKFKRGKPACRLYYVTTGVLQEDQNLEARRAHIRDDLRALGIFDNVDVNLVGAPELQRAYNQTKKCDNQRFYI